MKSITLYNSAICNLNCRYCFISKNQGLQEVDKEIENSFQTSDYYIKFLKELLSKEEIEDIEEVSLWGGEPLLNLQRIFPFIEDFIPIAPKFHKIFFSSNFSHSKVIPSLVALYEFLIKFNQKFEIIVQISCDGPEDITDAGRGLGVTKNILKNLEKLENTFPILTQNDNIVFRFQIKPTLDKNSFLKLQDYDYNIEYYSFFENQFLDIFKNNNIQINFPMPNLAMPADYTQEDGFILRDICKIERQIEKDNKKNKIFKYYETITLFSNSLSLKESKLSNQNFGCENVFCGYGYNTLGLLPNHLITGCHRSFAEYNEKYNKFFNNSQDDKTILLPEDMLFDNHYMIFQTKEQLHNYQEVMKAYQPDKKTGSSTSLLYTNTMLLMALAQCDLVEKKYLDMQEALLGVKRIVQKGGVCINDNLFSTGTTNCIPTYKLKLFANGALDYIFEENEG